MPFSPKLVTVSILAASAFAVACSDSGYSPPLVNEVPVVTADAGSDAPTPSDAAPAKEAAAPFPGICSPTTSWIKPKSVGLSPNGRFGAVTPDETTIAWMEGDWLHWADRKTAGDKWGPEDKVFVKASSSSRIAVAPSGLRVVLVVANGRNFGEVTRATKDDAFGDTIDSSKFQSFAFALGEAPPQAELDDPVLAKDDDHFYFTFSTPNAGSTLRQSVRSESGNPWSFGQPISQTDLAPKNGKLRRPTGISSDRLTLFYWDEPTSTERAAFRTAESEDFSLFANLGDRPTAQVDTTCTHLYYESSGDFVYGTRQ